VPPDAASSGAGAARVVVCGDVINDILVKPAAPVMRGSDTVSVIKARPGGSAATQAAWMAHLGLDVVFVGRCGARDADYHRRSLAAAGVRAEITADPDAETGAIVIMVSPDGERTMFTDRGANLRLRAADIPAGLLDGAALLHLTGYSFFTPSLLEVALSLLADARSRGVPVTIDPGSAAFLAQLKPGEFLRWTDGAAVCFPNLDEAAVLTGAALTGDVLTGAALDPAAMAVSLAKHYGAVALKVGGGGCVLAVAGAEPVQVPAPQVEAQDTTGAGDAFCGAFLSRWLVRGAGSRSAGLRGAGLEGADLRGAAEFAVLTAATAVTVFGGRPPVGSSHESETAERQP
jgi:sugar/nucleoside kinase (ribokinase family)